MPLYEYECAQCGRRYERIQKFSDAADTNCAVCGGAVRRLLSPSALHFKGSGWYVTDYARKSGATAESAAGNGSKAEKTDTTEKKDAVKTESKPAESSKKQPHKTPRTPVDRGP
jgi:putative FmdB family regulatory protein